MKTLRIALITAIALLVTVPLMAQERERKKGPAKQLSPVSQAMLRMTRTHEAIEELDLSDEQKESLKAVHKEFGPKMGEVFGKLKDVLTEEQQTAAKEAAKAAKEADKKGRAFFVAVEASITLTDEQTEQMNEIGEELTTLQREVTRKVLGVLTDEQRKQLRAKRNSGGGRGRGRDDKKTSE